MSLISQRQHWVAAKKIYEQIFEQNPNVIFSEILEKTVKKDGVYVCIYDNTLYSV